MSSSAGAFLALPGFGTFSDASAQTNENAFEQELVSSQSERGVLAPVLGNYPDTSLLLSRDTTVTPDMTPTNTTSINVSTSTNFKGTLEGNPASGVVRVTDAHPAGTYTVTVRAFDSGGASTTRTFTLIVTTPVTCNPVSFAPAANFSAGNAPLSVAVGDFNGDGKQDLAVAQQHRGRGPDRFVGRWRGPFRRRHEASALAVILSQSRWAISTAMASRTWP